MFLHKFRLQCHINGGSRRQFILKISSSENFNCYLEFSVASSVHHDSESVTVSSWPNHRTSWPSGYLTAVMFDNFVVVDVNGLVEISNSASWDSSILRLERRLHAFLMYVLRNYLWGPPSGQFKSFPPHEPDSCQKDTGYDSVLLICFFFRIDDGKCDCDACFWSTVSVWIWRRLGVRLLRYR